MRSRIAVVVGVVAVVLLAVPAAAQTPATTCYDGAATWQNLCIRAEPTGKRRGYVRAKHADSEAEIIRRLPTATGAHFKTPYTCKRFTVDTTGKAATDIEHIVALAEAHDSGLAPSLRHAFANDLDNLTVADKSVNRSKSSKDAGEWQPTHNGGWFAAAVIRVKQKYGLSVDDREKMQLELLLASGRSLHCP